jgi:hypothetical protein
MVGEGSDVASPLLAPSGGTELESLLDSASTGSRQPLASGVSPGLQGDRLRDDEVPEQETKVASAMQAPRAMDMNGT